MRISRGILTIAAAVVASVLTGCGGAADEPKATPPSVSTPAAAGSSATTTSAPVTVTTTSPAGPPDATAVAERVKAGVQSVTKLVTITEGNDPNDKIGRPGGYVSAATLYDEGATCTELGADCGATVEVWPDEGSATARSQFIQEALKGANGLLGEEYHYQDGPALLRVTGQIKPSTAKTYGAAFTQQ
jgi:hypothetical protein